MVQPLVTPTQAQDTNYTLKTISLSHHTKGNAPACTSDGAAAFKVTEGVLMIQIGDYPAATLYAGDIAFIPVAVSFTHYPAAAFAKMLYVSSSSNGVDTQLINGGKDWDYAIFPKY